MIKKFFLSLGLFATGLTTAICQDDGYWDNNRAYSRETNLCAGCKDIYKVDLPIGTTEVIYRITLLDENQQLASSLVSVLGSIPSPTGITQGAAGAIALFSKIAGEDKCKFTIFSTLENAEDYKDNGNYQSGCFSYSYEINKFAGRLSLSSSNCLDNSPNAIWFGFKSFNHLMNEKIVLEVVPWVDKKASRGWTLETKNAFITSCKEAEEIADFSDPEQFCQCVLDKFQVNYKRQDFEQMTSSEIDKISNTFAQECLAETGEMENAYNELRNEAYSLAEKGKYSEAITKLLDVIENSTPTHTDYNNIGFYYIFTKQYIKAIKVLKKGDLLEDADLLIKGNLAHAYLLNGDIEEAKAIYIKYKNQNVTDNMSWVEMVKSDFEAFKKAGLPTDNFDMIIQVIK